MVVALTVAIVVAGVGLALTFPDRLSIERRPDRPEFDDVPAPASLDVETLEPNLSIIRGGGGTTAVFVTHQGVVLVDPKFAASWPALERAVRTITPLPITHVIVTHFHNDHAEAVAVLPPSVKVVAQAHAVERLIFFRHLPDDALVTGRAVSYQERLALFDGAERIRLFWPGALHTNGDTIVSFEAARVLHMGDVFPGKRFPIAHIEGGGDGTRFAAGMQTVLREFPDATRIITGHSDVMGRDDVAEFGEFMGTITAYVDREMGMFRDKNAVFRGLVLPTKFADYDRARQFDTMDEIDRSLRPRWQRVF
ncbi:MAG: MBL fold metallo-hydrolase [Vicinamibacterales bacterium]